MATAENARLHIEAGQILVPMTLLADSGDHLNFTGAAGLWSAVNSKTPLVLPNGVRSGGAITPSGVNDEVSVAALELNLNGVVTSVAAGDVTVVRTAAGGVFQINSITVTAAGALANIAGTEGAAFVAERGAAGGPPLIPVDSVEIGQVRLVSNTAAPVLAGEIYQVAGEHQERANFPLYTVNRYSGQVTFIQEFPLIHTGVLAKRVYAQYYTPIFTPVPNCNTVVLPEKSYSLNSTPTYDGPVGSVSSSLGQGSFTALVDNGIDDLLVQLSEQNLWFKFYPDRYKTQYHAFQAILGITRSFPADGNIAIAATLNAEQAGRNIA